MNIIWTRHAEERQKEWQKKLGITKQEVEDLLHNPEQIITEKLGVFVAQARTRNGLLRAPFVEIKGDRKILTIYCTSRVEKYWR